MGWSRTCAEAAPASEGRARGLRMALTQTQPHSPCDHLASCCCPAPTATPSCAGPAAWLRVSCHQPNFRPLYMSVPRSYGDPKLCSEKEDAAFAARFQKECSLTFLQASLAQLATLTQARFCTARRCAMLRCAEWHGGGCAALRCAAAAAACPSLCCGRRCAVHLVASIPAHSTCCNPSCDGQHG